MASHTSPVHVPEDKVQKYIDAAERSKSWTNMRDLLYYLRRSRQRRSELVVRYGVPLLDQYSSKLGSECWDYYEQVFIASLDGPDQTLSERYLDILKKQFPGSVRVRKLSAMLCEAQGRHAEASALYWAILQEDPADAFAMKRQIATFKARGDVANAIDLTNTYLQIFMGDVEAWSELASLYLGQGQLKQAASCYEELILSAPQNYLYYLRYAEIVYTMGGTENFRLARKYYAHSLELNERNNVRALYGLAACTYAISSALGHRRGGSSSAPDKDELGGDLVVYAVERLTQAYTAAGVPELGRVSKSGFERMRTEAQKKS
eukprot:TRINITY_DN13796_c0_g1_i1.p1 TRINITY_DN13796_c0_g1~~TRINITY_DN13796_c0_g1_i1.p1  ORF type:complete len:320 (+),score=47.20 TRINITY_DN13796_c0_g1_i1:1-960(+)